MSTSTTRTPTKKAPARKRTSSTTAAKKPQDRQAPAPKTVDGYRVGTVRGVEWRIPVEKLDDWDLMENLQRNNVIPAANAMFDAAQLERAKDLVRDENGRVPYSEMFALCMEILKGLAPSS